MKSLLRDELLKLLLGQCVTTPDVTVIVAIARASALSEHAAKQILERPLVDAPSTIKAEIFARSYRSKDSREWPKSALGWPLGAVLKRTEDLCSERSERQKKSHEAEKQQGQRRERMTEMVQAPRQRLRKAEKLVEARGTSKLRSRGGNLG